MQSDRDALLRRLSVDATRVALAVPNVRLFVFGTLLHGKGWPADVDILLVYNDELEAAHARALLRTTLHDLPIHILLLSVAEEAQLGFVACERCLEIGRGPPPNEALQRT